MYDQSLDRKSRLPRLRLLLQRWVSDSLSFSCPLYPWLDANGIAFLGHPLVFLHRAHAFIIGLKLKLEQLQGDDWLDLVQGQPL